MSAPRLGLSYFGNRYPGHARNDLRVIRETGASIVDHVMSEEDLRWNPGTIADLVEASRDAGLETWLAPWGLAGAFGGEAASYAVMESPEQCQRDNDGIHLPALCLNQQAFRDVMRAWLDAAASAKVDVVTWDEPHLALPAPDHPDGRWACRCEYCQGLFTEQFGHSMPVQWDEEVASFSHQTVSRALDFLIDAAAERNLASAVIFLPDESMGDRGWREIAANPSVRYFGVSPYWLFQGIPEDERESWLRTWCRRVVTATDRQAAQSLAWIQAFSVPAGREPELEWGMQVMAEEGIDVVCAWSYRACEAMSGLAPDDPEATWQAVQRGFATLQSQE